MVTHSVTNGNFNSSYHQDIGRVFYGLLPDRRDDIQRRLDQVTSNAKDVAEIYDGVLSTYQNVVTELLEQYVARKSIEPKLKPLAEAVGMMNFVRDKYRPIIDALPEDMAKRARDALGY